MRRVAALLSVAAVVLWSASAFAQGAKPSFAGKWTREAPAAGAPAGGGGGGGRGGGGGGGFCGAECTITQTATELTLEYMGGGQNPTAMKQVYKLDGTVSKNPGRGGQDMESKAAWDGAKLVITTTTPNGEQKRVLSLEGGNLVVEATNPGREGGAATTAKITFKKAA
jgi:hypothetical protein